MTTRVQRLKRFRTLEWLIVDVGAAAFVAAVLFDAWVLAAVAVLLTLLAVVGAKYYGAR